MWDMRRFLADRWSGGLLAALVAVLLVAQAGASAWHCAAALQSAGDAGLTICHGAGGVSSQNETPRAPDDLLHGCPGGVLCGALALAAVPDAPMGAPHRTADAGRTPLPTGTEDGRAARPHAAPPYPTGPPRLSA